MKPIDYECNGRQCCDDETGNGGPRLAIGGGSLSFFDGSTSTSCVSNRWNPVADGSRRSGGWHIRRLIRTVRWGNVCFFFPGRHNCTLGLSAEILPYFPTGNFRWKLTNLWNNCRCWRVHPTSKHINALRVFEWMVHLLLSDTSKTNRRLTHRNIFPFFLFVTMRTFYEARGYAHGATVAVDNGRKLKSTRIQIASEGGYKRLKERHRRPNEEMKGSGSIIKANRPVTRPVFLLEAKWCPLSTVSKFLPKIPMRSSLSIWIAMLLKIEIGLKFRIEMNFLKRETKFVQFKFWI